MNNSRILFIGIGQCGNNIVNEFDKLGYNTFAINTSELDLKTINVPHKFKIPNALGCAKDRKKALGYFKNNYNKIFNAIEGEFKEQDLIFLVFSLGGGTGSGMSPILIDALSRKYTDKIFNAIVCIPSQNESIQSKVNSVEAYNELIKVPNLGSLFVIDNNCSESKMAINKQFVDLFNSVVGIAKPNENGVIDDYEIEKLITCKGTSMILKFENGSSIENIGSAESIFLENKKGCKYMGISTNGQYDMSLLENEFGSPLDVFKGYNDKYNLLIVAGMEYPMSYFNKLDSEIIKYKEISKKQLVSSSIDTSTYKDLNIQVKLIEEFDFETLLSEYNS